MHYGNVFAPHSPLAGGTADLLRATFIVCAVIFALVVGLVTLCIFRFRSRSHQNQEPLQIRGHKPLEIVWTIGPFLILVYLFVLTVRAMEISDPPEKGRKPDLVVIGHQFWWEVRYPNGNAVTANEIHIPVGRKLLVQLETADVIHTFWVPQLTRKMDMIPDRANSIWLEADRPGTYFGACSEFCGAQHAGMRISVVAEAPDEFANWEQQQLQAASRPGSPAALRGADLFRQLTCANCHAVRGLQLAPPAAPDLTHVASRHTLAAGVLENRPANLARWITNSQSLKPGNLMPPMRLTESQTADLVAYLETLR